MESRSNEVLNGRTPAEPLMIDITPVGCSTPEGNARVAKAIKDFDDATAALANAAIEFLDVSEDIHQLRALIGARNRKQEAFLAAVAGSSERKHAGY